MPAPAYDDGMGDIDFQPVSIDFDELVGGGGGHFRIHFRPSADLYAKANDANRLIRECLALGEGEVTCDTEALPALEEIDPEGSYLAWTIDLRTDADETAIREIFEFVEDDCTLEIERLGDPSQESGIEAADGDIASLLARLQGEVAAGGDADSAPADDAGEGEPAEAVSRPVAARAQKPSGEGADGEAGKGEGRSEARASGPAAIPGSIRVDLDRVDRLINLVGELVIHQVVLSQRVMKAGLARGSDVALGLEELEQLTREIQDSVMAIRAQPVKSVFQKLPRLVREVSAATGKPVRLVTEGEGTEVDKTVIEKLSDPLTHMIRNAIDHGIESPEDRVAAGKPPEGQVRVAATHRSGRIVIEIGDDGAGINREVVRNIAVSKDLIPADANLTDEEIDNLIFLPGFSTRTEVSELSGRGVGMDVVKRSIQALGGRVSITSKPGKGSLFTMSLPLTLAVLDGMIVTIGEHTLVVPLTAIIETMKPKRGEVREFGHDQRLISVRDTFLPLVDVGRHLGFRSTPGDAETSVCILVEAENGGRSALLVDSIQGQRQVVIKSLESNYGRVPGVAAATILGDGRVALILDVDAVASSSRFETNPFGNQLIAAE